MVTRWEKRDKKRTAKNKFKQQGRIFSDDKKSSTKKKRKQSKKENDYYDYINDQDDY